MPDEELLHPTYQVVGDGAPPLSVRRRGEGIVGRVFDDQQPRFVADYATWEGASADGRQAGVRAAIAAPVVHAGHPLGVLVARTTAPGIVFNEEDAQLLGLLAAHTAVAFTNARLYAQQREIASHAAHRTAEIEAVLESMTDGVLLVDRCGMRDLGQPGGGVDPRAAELAVGSVSLSDLLAAFRPSEHGAPEPRSSVAQRRHRACRRRCARCWSASASGNSRARLTASSRRLGVTSSAGWPWRSTAR